MMKNEPLERAIQSIIDNSNPGFSSAEGVSIEYDERKIRGFSDFVRVLMSHLPGEVVHEIDSFRIHTGTDGKIELSCYRLRNTMNGSALFLHRGFSELIFRYSFQE